MLTNKNDRYVHRFPKDAAVTTSLQKKGNTPHLIPRLKLDRQNKPKPESFITPAPRIRNKKHQNCFPLPDTPRSYKKTPTTLNMKTVSLVALPSEEKKQPKTQRKTVSRENWDSSKLTIKVEKRTNNVFNSNNIFNFTSARESELAKYVCRKFILQAWRKQRAQTVSLQLLSKSLNKEVENLGIQKCVLKALLESENERVTHSMNELNIVKNQLEEQVKNSKELNELLSRREVSFSEEKISWHLTEIQMEERIGSLKAELDKAVNNSFHLNKKALNYEEKLDEHRKDGESLKVKLELVESSLQDKINEVNTLKNKCIDLQMTVEGLVTRNQELAHAKDSKEKQIKDYINNLKNLEVELNNFQNIQKVRSSEFVELKKDYEEVKTQITQKDIEIGGLQETVKHYETEEKQLEIKWKKAALRVFQLTLNLIPLPNYIPFM